MKIFEQLTSSPLGEIYIRANNHAILRIDYVKEPKKLLNLSNDLTQKAHQQLQEYFQHKRKTFSLPIQLKGTPFQKVVWNALSSIDFGQTRSYSYIAEQINNPKAVRAVGNTNRLNPISIIIPCHRVIGKNKNLVGYNGGLDKKLWLLKHEKTLL